jgi:gamma-glutamyltranspeptidase
MFSILYYIVYSFGSLMVSESTGIIWNNEMADFSLFDTNNVHGLKVNIYTCIIVISTITFYPCLQMQ